MSKPIFFHAGHSAALPFACRALADSGISFAERAGPEVTHLLLPVPSFENDGRLRGGENLKQILADLPPDITVIGGNLTHPALAGCHTMDLLRDGYYAAENAAITADCALRIAGQNMTTVFSGCPVLVIGWGRIGKSLSQMLRALDARVTVAARNPKDRQSLCALGYHTIDFDRIGAAIMDFKIVFNTVPAPILTEKACDAADGCLLIELASQPGILSSRAIKALGLPGKLAPEASGALIAKTILRLLS